MTSPRSKPAARRVRSQRRALAVLAGAALLVAPVVALAANPPTATTQPADPTLITDTYALISGTVNPGGTATTYYFEWGPTNTYGQTTPVTSAGNGTADVPVDVSLDELQPSTTYHYRLVAGPATPSDPANPGLVYGEDASFTTAPALALTVTGGKTAVQSNRAQISISCVGPADDVCEGRLNLKARINKKAQNIGSAGYSVAVGATKVVAVYLTPPARAALKAAKTKRLAADATAKTKTVPTPATARLVLAG